ncbi:MAG: pantoate--beta-alanine ligase [Bdellovibrionales bacterium]
MSNPLLRLVESVSEMRELSALYRAEQLSIGFVPTMGALHEGHLSLLKKSLKETDVTICSIYVNPTQFNDKKDFENYPITLPEDLEKLKSLGVQIAFCPSYQDMYPDGYKYRVSESDLSQILCGEHRPGHFDGVLTVVMKLFNITQPHKAYFGEKDYQQLLLIKKMAKSFFMNVEVIACPTLREEDGLAMSSRNRLLPSEDRRLAPQFSKLLKSSQSTEKISSELEKLGFKVDYIQEVLGHRFGAVRLGQVRLIDNVQI